MARASEVIGLLAVHLDECFSGHAWHGASLYQTLGNLDVRQALHESSDGYSAWKVALHCAYWKFRVRKRLVEAAGHSAGRFGRSPADWPNLPETRDREHWRADLAFLQDQHKALREALFAMPPSLLGSAYDREGNRYHRLITGVAAHDAYHTAQVRNIGIPGLQ